MYIAFSVDRAFKTLHTSPLSFVVCFIYLLVFLVRMSQLLLYYITVGTDKIDSAFKKNNLKGLFAKTGNPVFKHFPNSCFFIFLLCFHVFYCVF